MFGKNMHIEEAGHLKIGCTQKVRKISISGKTRAFENFGCTFVARFISMLQDIGSHTTRHSESYYRIFV